MVLVIDKHKKPRNTISNAYARILLFKKLKNIIMMPYLWVKYRLNSTSLLIRY